jgi:hypothetical protein
MLILVKKNIIRRSKASVIFVVVTRLSKIKISFIITFIRGYERAIEDFSSSRFSLRIEISVFQRSAAKEKSLCRHIWIILQRAVFSYAYFEFRFKFRVAFRTAFSKSEISTCV